ncbi:MAG: tetratricopeptide repeat protein [Fulvivirga sp.]
MKIHLKKHHLISLLLLFNIISKAQDVKRDSAEICTELGRRYYTAGKNDSSLFFYHKALVHTNNESQCMDAFQGLSVTFLWLTQYDSAKYYLTRSQGLAEQIKDYPRLAGIYNSWGNLHLQEGDKTEALKKYIYAAKLQDSLLNDPLGKATALANIGNVQYLMGNLNNGLEYIKEAQTLAQANDLKNVIAYTSQLVGRIYRKQNKLDEALIEYQKALNVYLQMGQKREACETYVSSGNIHFDKTSFQEALNKYKTALNIAKEISNDPLLGMIYAAMSSTLHQLKRNNEAILYADSAQTIGKKINDQYTVLDSYEILSLIFESQKDYQESLSHFRKYSRLKDSLNEVTNRGQFEELEMKYQNEKKTTEIEFLKSDKALNEANLSRQRALQIGTTVALLSVIIISILLVNRYRVINKAKRLLEIERVRNNIARDLHDDIGSTLSSINILSKVAMVEPGSNTQHYLQRIGDQSTRIMEEMGDIVWSIHPGNDSTDRLIARMREFLTEIFEPLNIEYTFLESIDKNFILNSEKRKNLFLIFKETINNAIKYSNATFVEISLTKTDTTLVMTIKDNGKGFDEQTTKAGNGLKNLRERSHEVGGNITLKSTIGEGTELRFTLPIT